MGIIYKATNKINNHFYIGQTRCGLSKRKSAHLSDSRRRKDSSKLFHKAIRDFGKENFQWEIIFESSDQWELDQKEQSLIISLKPNYNLSQGGFGTHIRTEEERRKISENHADFSGEKNPNYGKKPRPWMDGEMNPSKSPEVKLKQQRAARKRSRDKFGRFIRKEKK